MSTVIDNIEAAQLRTGHPSFAPGDRVRVHFQVIEGNRRRVQVFEGVVLRRQGSGLRETFTVRKQSFGVGVERTFPVHSPKIEQLEVAARGDVRRAKLYYLRGRIGKAARVTERRWGSDDDLNGSATTPEATDIEPTVEEQPEATAEAAAEAPVEAEAASVDAEVEAPAETDAPAESEAPAETDTPAEAEAEAPAEAEQEASDGEGDEASESKA